MHNFLVSKASLHSIMKTEVVSAANNVNKHMNNEHILNVTFYMAITQTKNK